ncbi:MAG: hypothetical protein LBR41_02225 [Rickettsiales bacterium]|jgi:hypothetical protein|nr:hypothetical protein [Rickettsiales bacterium]
MKPAKLLETFANWARHIEKCDRTELETIARTAMFIILEIKSAVLISPQISKNI